VPVPSSEPALRHTAFGLRVCTRCGTAVTVGEAPASLYETGAYSPGRPRLHRLAQPALRAFDRRRLALLAPLVGPPARLLDVGAGKGRFVAAALAAGYEASGIEPSARGTDAAAEIGAPVTRATIDLAAIGAATLDAVTLWHVLEHLDDPAAALRRIAGWLRPGGALLVGVPNYAGVQARIGGGRWYHLDVPRHRVHYTPAGLTMLLRAHDFEPVRATQVLAEHNPFGMWQTIVNRATRDPSYLYNLLKRNAPPRSADLAVTVLALPLAPLAAAAELVAGLAGRGGTIAVAARRLPRVGDRLG
jgi:SAM-dependent methyltransferase